MKFHSDMTFLELSFPRPTYISVSTPIVSDLISVKYIIPIDFSDLMRWGKKIANSQVDRAEPFIVFPIMALIYFALCFPLSHLSKWLERRQNAGNPDQSSRKGE